MAQRFSIMTEGITDEEPSMLDPMGKEAYRSMAQSSTEIGANIRRQMFENKRMEKMANRVYKEAARSRDPSKYIQAYNFMRDVRAGGGSLGGGIRPDDGSMRPAQLELYRRAELTGQRQNIPGTPPAGNQPNRPTTTGTQTATNQPAGANRPSGTGQLLDEISNRMLSFDEKAERASLIKTGQGAFGRQGKIDKAKSLLDRFANDPTYTEAQLKRDAELMGSDPDIAVNEGYKKARQIRDKKFQNEANLENRSKAQEILSQFDKDEIEYEDAVRSGIDIGGNEATVRSKLDAIVKRKATELQNDEEDQQIAEKERKAQKESLQVLGTKVDRTNREISGKEPTQLTPSSSTLEERLSRFEEEKKQSAAENQTLIDEAKATVERSNQNIEETRLADEKRKSEGEALMRVTRAVGEQLQESLPALGTDAPRQFRDAIITDRNGLYNVLMNEITDQDRMTLGPEQLKAKAKQTVERATEIGLDLNRKLGGKEATAYDGQKYQTNAFGDLKRIALKNDRYAGGTQKKIIIAALESGYPIELDPELMANEQFVENLNKIKKQYGITGSLNKYGKEKYTTESIIKQIEKDEKERERFREFNFQF
jgi:hypothetical protein